MEKQKTNGIYKFKRFIKFVVSIIISREFAFIYCVLGTTAQIAHTYFLTDSISSLSGNWRMIQAVILSIFISSSLLYFVAIADKDDRREYEKVEQSIIVFTIIEIIINLYYYSRHLLLDVWKDGKEPNYFDFVFACIIGILIPITIKMYSSHIKAKEWLQEFQPKSDNNDINNDDLGIVADLQNKINELETKLNPSSITSEIDMEKINKDIEEKVESSITESFRKNQDKFINQFENKIKLLSKQTLENNNIE